MYEAGLSLFSSRNSHGSVVPNWRIACLLRGHINSKVFNLVRTIVVSIRNGPTVVGTIAVRIVIVVDQLRINVDL